jgi:hypothetical protein
MELIDFCDVTVTLSKLGYKCVPVCAYRLNLMFYFSYFLAEQKIVNHVYMQGHRQQQKNGKENEKEGKKQQKTNFCFLRNFRKLMTNK